MGVFSLLKEVRWSEEIRGIREAALSVAEDRDISPRGGDSLIPGVRTFPGVKICA